MLAVAGLDQHLYVSSVLCCWWPMRMYASSQSPSYSGFEGILSVKIWYQHSPQFEVWTCFELFDLIIFFLESMTSGCSIEGCINFTQNIKCPIGLMPWSHSKPMNMLAAAAIDQSVNVGTTAQCDTRHRISILERPAPVTLNTKCTGPRTLLGCFTQAGPIYGEQQQSDT